jgi:hypothetical protein
VFADLGGECIEFAGGGGGGQKAALGKGGNGFGEWLWGGEDH